jgi:hypothetical protein
MSRTIDIEYQEAGSNRATTIEIRAPYYMLGTQNNSVRFWSIPKLKEIGIARLSKLGETDPIYFTGWDMIADLGREIALLQQHLDAIEFDPELKAQWLSHLVYCYNLLIQTAPKDSIPEFSIG